MAEDFDYVIKDGFENMNFTEVTSMLSKAFWSIGIKRDEVEKGAHNSALVTGAFDKNGRQVGYNERCA